jgi:alpha-methylacyl-CoA racemase
MSGPLQGIRVIEMAGMGPGPFCAMMLADMGAEVIRIERKPNDAPSVLDEMRQSVMDRGRRSIALDIKKPGAVEVALRLIESADALIEGFRPGVMERLGLGPEVCAARNPRLVYGRMTGWGQNGPLAQTAGHDLNYIAISGALNAMGHADRPPAPPLHLVGDMGGGAMMLAFGIVCALLEAKKSGEGQVVDAAISDGAACLAAMFFGMRANGQWSDRRADNMLDGGAHFYGCYECSDGRYISIGAIEPQFYRLLLDKCGIDDPAFNAQWDKTQWPVLRGKLANLFRQRSQADWCALLEGTDVCFAPVLDFDEAPSHPHHRARATFVEIDNVIQPAPAPRFSRTPGAAGRVPRAVGEHSELVLAEAGFSVSDVASLVAAGVL